MFRKMMMGLLLGCCLSPAGATDTVIYYHNDALGSPIAATNAQGQVIWREQYKPYGERLVKAPESRNALWYTGKPEEAALGLSYFGARWYAPGLGRFMSIDPAEVQAENLHSFNRYAYANNNPYKFVDPDGRAAETVTDLISLGISVGMFIQDPSLGNAVGILGDAVGTAVPFLPAGIGSIRSGLRAADKAGDVTKNVAPAKRASNQTILGHYPDYVKLSDELGARRFDIPIDIWNKMTHVQQWETNRKFLDRMISKGDEVIGSVSILLYCNFKESGDRMTYFFQREEVPWY
jgi:RHS repeat-associated protein